MLVAHSSPLAKLALLAEYSTAAYDLQAFDYSECEPALIIFALRDKAATVMRASDATLRTSRALERGAAQGAFPTDRDA